MSAPKDTMDRDHLVKTAARVGLVMPKLPGKEQIDSLQRDSSLMAEQTIPS